jgi:integrase
MDSLTLAEISAEKIQHVISTALSSGYSIQTATHIRNVIRAIFAHAIASGLYAGTNPATLVTLPAMARRKAHTLTLGQLQQVMQIMHHPERDIALFALLTEMNVTEICGLKWKYANFSNEGHYAGEEWMPPRTIAVRNQWYRGELAAVHAKRKRSFVAPDLLCTVLRELKLRHRFTGAEDFVLVSRSGTPLYAENVAARRLKIIGRACEIPWISWFVFHRTHMKLKSEFGRQLYKEYERVLPIQPSTVRYATSRTGKTL